MPKLSRAKILRLFQLLNAELARRGVEGEVCVVGGAVMCLAFGSRESTQDVDAVFEPAEAIRAAAERVASKTGAPTGWLNDAVKAYLGARAEFEPFLELPNLRVFVARPAYLLAMKCAAMRLGEEFQDLDDVRFLLRRLNIETAEEALAVVTQYFDEPELLPKTRLALQELLGK